MANKADANNLLENLNSEFLQSNYIELKKKFEESQALIETLQSEARDNAKAKASLSQELANAKETIKNIQDKGSRYETRFAFLETESQTRLTKLNEALDTIKELKESNQTKDTAVTKLRQQNKTKELSIIELEGEQTISQLQIKSLLSQKENYQKTLTDLRQSHNTQLKEEKDRNLKLQLSLNAESQTLIATENEVQELKKKHAQVLENNKAAEEEKEMAKLNLMSLRSAYKSLETALSTNSSAYSRRIAQLENQLSEQKLMVEDVSTKLKTAEESLQEEKSLREEYFDKFINSEVGAPSNVSGEWLESYISFQKAPANIFKDYFKLHREHDTLKLQYKISSDMVNSLKRQQINATNMIKRLESELNSFEAQETKLKSQVDGLDAQVEQLRIERDDKQKESDEHKAESEELKKGLTDLRFQTKIILEHIERRREPIPASQQELYELLMKDRTNPVLPSNLLIGDNIHQILDLNGDLQFELRKAFEKAAGLEKQIESLKAAGQESKIKADKALQECNQTINTLKEDLAEKENRTPQATSQEQAQDAYGDSSKAIAQEQYDIAFDDYKKETKALLEKAQDDFHKAQLELAECKAKVSNWELERKSLQNDIDRWCGQSDLFQNELKDVKAESTSRLNKIWQLEDNAREAEAALSKVKDTVCQLEVRSENLKKKLEFSEEARQGLKKQLEDESVNNNKLISKIDRLSDILAENKKEYKDELNAKVQELHNNIDMKNDSISQKDIEIGQLRTASLEFTATLNSARADAKSLRKQLAEANSRLIDIQAEKIAIENELNGLKSQYEVDDVPAMDAPVHNPQKFALKVEKLEAANFAYHEEIEQLRNTIESLKAGHTNAIQIMNNSYGGLQEQLKDKVEKGNDLQRLYDDLKNLHDSYVEQSTSKIEQYASERAELKQRIFEHEGSLTKLNSQIDILTEKLAEQTSELTRVKKELDDEKMVNGDAQAQSLKANEELGTLKAQLETTYNELRVAKEARSRLQSRYDEALENYSEEKEELLEAARNADQMNKNMNTRLQRLTVQIADIAESYNGEEASKITEEAIRELQNTNDALREQRDLIEKQHVSQKEKTKLAEDQNETYRLQLANLDARYAHVLQHRDALLEKSHADASEDKMFAEALKTQNTKLLQENDRLKQKSIEGSLKEAELQSAVSKLNLQISNMQTTIDKGKAEVESLIKSNKDWARRSKELLHKFHQVDPQEIEKMKTELASAQKQLDALKAEKDVLGDERETLLAAKTKLEEERAELIRKCNERGRALLEAKKKAEQQEKDTPDKNAGASATSDEVRALTAEKEKLDAEVAKLQQAVEEKEKENKVLEKKFSGILQRARTIQASNQQLKEEQAGKVKKISELEKELEEAPAKTAELEKELASIKKQMDVNNVDVARAKAQTSMANNKNKKLQLELDSLKSKLEELTGGQVPGSPVGVKRSREVEEVGGGSPTKKQAT